MWLHTDLWCCAVAEAATQPSTAEAPARSLPTGPLAAGIGTAVGLASFHKQETADQVSTALAMHSSTILAQPSAQLQASAASAQLDACAQHLLPEQASGKERSSIQTGSEIGGHSRKRRRASKASDAHAAEASEANHSSCGQELAATAPAPDARHNNVDPTTSLQAAAGSHGVGEAGKMVSTAAFILQFSVQHVAGDLI